MFLMVGIFVVDGESNDQEILHEASCQSTIERPTNRSNLRCEQDIYQCLWKQYWMLIFSQIFAFALPSKCEYWLNLTKATFRIILRGNRSGSERHIFLFSCFCVHGKKLFHHLLTNCHFLQSSGFSSTGIVTGINCEYFIYEMFDTIYINHGKYVLPI